MKYVFENVEEIVEFLQSEGFEVVNNDKPDNSIVYMYYDLGEFWENNPSKYVKAFTGVRDKFKKALDALDYDMLVRNWSDKTMYSVGISGSDLAFNKRQRMAISSAVNREMVRRYPPVVPQTHGMGLDGRQE